LLVMGAVLSLPEGRRAYHACLQPACRLALGWEVSPAS